MSRYAAFISYSHSDQLAARWLHRALEGYRLPKSLIGTDSPFGEVPRRLPPVFRDRDELPASGDLGQELRAALADSRFQIVICSPHSAKSKWVNEEILSFKRLHGEFRTLALILDGEPYASGSAECFPPALRYRLNPDGTLSDAPAEPIAADIRPGKDGRRLALLKLIAGVTGLKLDALARRDAARRQRRLMMVTIASLCVATVTVGLAIYAEGQRRVAEQQRRLADKSLEFLIGTFSIANPATENPRTITALSILDRVSKRADSELKSEPAVGARLLQTTGEIYFNLGLPKEAERDLRAALARQPARSEGRARTLLKLSAVAYKRGDAKESRALIDGASHAIDSDASYAPALEAQIAERIGLVELLEGHYASAAGTFNDAVEKYQALAGDYRQDIGRNLMNEAQALLRQRELARADSLFGKAAAIYLAKFGTNHVLTATAIQNYALSAFEAGRYEIAEARIRRAVSIYNQVFDGDHPTVAAALILTGRIRTAAGDGKGAIEALDKARGIYSRLYGPTNAAVGDADFYAAEAEAQRGRTDAALARTMSTKAIYDLRYGLEDPDQVELLLLRSRILARGGRVNEARQQCGAGLALQERIDSNSPQLPETRKACAALATR